MGLSKVLLRAPGSTGFRRLGPLPVFSGVQGCAPGCGTSTPQAPATGSLRDVSSRCTWVSAPPSTSASRSRPAGSGGGHLRPAPWASDRALLREPMPSDARTRQMPICSRRRTVLVVSHDLDGLSAHCQPYLAPLQAHRFAASPQPLGVPAAGAPTGHVPCLRRRFWLPSPCPRCWLSPRAHQS